VKRVLYIVPGYTENVTSAKYSRIASHAKKLGFEVVRVQPQWKKGWSWQPSYVTAITRAIRKEPHEAVLLGFSWGALACFFAAKQVKPSGLILCSLSPWLVEDHYHLEQMCGELYPHLANEQMLKPAGSFASVHGVKAKTVLFIGEKEPAAMKHRALLVANNIPGAVYKEVRGVGHAVHKPEYQRLVKSALADF
jgi:hypothetical protein